MKALPRISSLVWLIAPLVACGYLAWISRGRLQHVENISSLAGRAGPVDQIESTSPTGYANGQRELILPERSEVSVDWILQTQQMVARREWRIRHVDYDNAPVGRAVDATSPYRWWLGTVAWADHVVSGRPIGLSVERAALYADPLLQTLVTIGSAGFVAWRFGALAAGLLSLGLVTVFPFTAGFLPGLPDHLGLARICALGSILLLLAGIKAGPRAGRWFAFAGIMGGVGVWVDVATMAPILAGVVPGGLFASWVVGRHAREGTACGWEPAFWRLWALGGASTILAAYLIEYYPGHWGAWHLGLIHPLYGLAWLGGGELIAQTGVWFRGQGTRRRFRDYAAVVLSLAAVAAVPMAMRSSAGGGSAGLDILSAAPANQPGSILTASLSAWLASGELKARIFVTLLPVVLLVPAGWQMLRRSTPLETRLMLSVACGPVLAALAFACWQMGWCSLLDCALLGLVVAAVGGSATSIGTRWWWPALMAISVLPGLIQFSSRRPADARMALSPPEAEELVERHLAHWLAKRTGEPGAVVYAPPQQTTSLCFYGGLRGIGTLAPENRVGFGVTLMVAAAGTIDEAQALLQARGVRYIVVPSWDPFFDEFAHLYLQKQFSNRTSLFIGGLRSWSLPLWVRPLPYHMLGVPGFEGQSVLVFEVVEDQSPAAAAGRLAEYLVEMEKLDQASAVGESLRRFPGDVGALAALAQVQRARGDTAGLAQTLPSLLTRLSSGGDRFLPWDRRVSLAIVLAQANHVDLAREQVRRCLAELNETKLRFLPSGLLYNLDVLTKGFELPIGDDKLRRLTLDLLPDELRSRL